MRKNKDLAWKSFNQSPTRENYSYAFIKDKLYSDEEFRLKSNYEKKLTNNLKTNCKGFYSYLRNKRQLKTGIPTLERNDGSRTSGPAESAEVLAEAFSSVFVHEPENLPDVEKPEPNCDKLNDIDITFDKVKYELENLNCFKSYGPDGIHPKVQPRQGYQVPCMHPTGHIVPVKLYTLCHVEVRIARRCLGVRVTMKIQERRMRLAGHIHRHPELAAHQVLLWEPSHGNRSRGRPAFTYVDCLRKDTGLQDVKEIGGLMVDRLLWRQRIDTRTLKPP
ncbi:hypothetical protein ACHWQZ_G017305 [Mnemiopsis leidyi]